MKNNWIYSPKHVSRPHTRKSFKKMLTLSFDHFGKLSGAATTNPALVPLRDDYAPLHQTYSASLLRLDLGAWQPRGRDVSPGRMVRAAEPRGARLGRAGAVCVCRRHRPRGDAFSAKADAVSERHLRTAHLGRARTLATQLATFTTQPVLLTLSVTVQAFYDQMQAVRLAQTGLELSVSRSSRHLEQSRLACARGMFSNLGRLMHLMSDRPQGIGQFWELHLLRPTPRGAFADSLLIDPQTIATADLSPKQREKLTANTRLTIKNLSPRTVSLFVGFSTEPQAASPHAVELLPNEARELSASELGWSTTHTYLTAHNPHDQTATLSVMVKW
jgi:hypothetical protein